MRGEPADGDGQHGERHQDQHGLPKQASAQMIELGLGPYVRCACLWARVAQRLSCSGCLASRASTGDTIYCLLTGDLQNV